MIFVTVGTSRNEQLVINMDKLAPTLDDTVVIQLGSGKYKPKNCEYFDFAPSLDEYFDKADIIVGGGGVGTIYNLLLRGKKFIAVTSSHVPDPMQEQLPYELSRQGYLIWCDEVKRIGEALRQAKSFKFKRYVRQECWIDRVIIDFLTKKYM